MVPCGGDGRGGWLSVLVPLVVVAVVVVAVSAGGGVSAKTVPASDTTVKTRACLPPHDKYAFCNVSLSIDERVKNLISLLRDDEKAPLLTAREGGGGSPGPPGNISRIGLPEYDWGVNCIHGVQTSCVEVHGKTVCPSSFPNPVNFGATWNKTAFHTLGAIIATELRALWLLGATEESAWSGRPHAGLDCWSPNININRDPRWGRNQEVPSEDPLINGEFGKLYTKGLQEGEDNRYLKTIVTLKHWDAYSLEDSDGHTRHNFNAKVSNFALQDTYWPAFKMAVVDGKARGVMCSYNAVNGKPTCAHPLLAKVLRDKWSFDGYVTSDTGAIEDIYAKHHYAHNASAAVAVALRDGRCDMDSGAVYHNALLDAVRTGELSMREVDQALYNTLKLRFELGLFDPIEKQPYWHVDASAVNTTQSQRENMQMTLESMVLLKNDNSTLPFPKGDKVAVIGPHIHAREALVGNYLGQLCPDDGFDCIVSPLSAIEAINGGTATSSALGSGVLLCTDGGIQEAVGVAKKADRVVLLLGINDTIEAESNDRTSIDLPECQHRLAAAVAALDKPTVMVLINGGMLAVEQEKHAVPAIIEAGYPGYYGAVAIARTVFGDNDHLGGKLPYTVYPAGYVNEIKMSDMEMTTGPGRSYRFYNGTPLWPFGFGLSYTTFEVKCSGPSHASFSTAASKPFYISATVHNTGSRPGDTVVQVFMAPSNLDKRKVALKKQLLAFMRVHLGGGAQQDVSFSLTSSAFNLVDEATGNVVSTPGTFHLLVSDGVRQPLSFPITIKGDEKVVEKFPTL